MSNNRPIESDVIPNVLKEILNDTNDFIKKADTFVETTKAARRRPECSMCKFYKIQPRNGYDGYCKKNEHSVTDCSWCVCYKERR